MWQETVGFVLPMWVTVPPADDFKMDEELIPDI